MDGSTVNLADSLSSLLFFPSVLSVKSVVGISSCIRTSYDRRQVACAASDDSMSVLKMFTFLGENDLAGCARLL
jgi:hypothetical protein